MFKYIEIIRDGQPFINGKARMEMMSDKELRASVIADYVSKIVGMMDVSGAARRVEATETTAMLRGLQFNIGHNLTIAEVNTRIRQFKSMAV